MKKAVKAVIKQTLGAQTYNELPRKERREIVRKIERNLADKAKAETVNHLDAIDAHMGVEAKTPKTKTVPALVTIIKDEGRSTKSALQRIDEKLASFIDPELVDDDTDVVIDD